MNKFLIEDYYFTIFFTNNIKYILIKKYVLYQQY